MHCSVRGVSSKLRAARQNATDEPALRYTRDSSAPNCSLAGYLHECTSNFTVQKAATQYSGFVAEKTRTLLRLNGVGNSQYRVVAAGAQGPGRRGNA